MKVLFFTNMPSPYIVDFFNELGKLCELTVVFEKSTSTERDDSWKNYRFRNFKGIILKGFDTAPDMAFCPQVIQYIQKSIYDHIIVTNPTTPTGILELIYMKILKIPYIIESEGGFPKSGKGPKEKFKKFLMSGAKLYLSTTEMDDEYFLMYGAVREKIVKYPFTSLYEKDLLKDPLTGEDKTTYKLKIGVNYKKMILSVGSFIHRKGYDILLNACQYIDQDTGVYIVGGRPTDEYLEIRERLNLPNVHFVEFKLKKDLKDYFLAADLFVLPTREDTWGLVINEAMAYALPVITTNRCIAGLELVKDDENGYVVPVENEKTLADKMNHILSRDHLRETMGKKSLERIQWYTFESMARRHMDILGGYDGAKTDSI